MDRCPLDECQCDGGPPTECPTCGVTLLGATPEDWWEHFEEDCNGYGRLLCFAEPGEDSP